MKMHRRVSWRAGEGKRHSASQQQMGQGQSVSQKQMEEGCSVSKVGGTQASSDMGHSVNQQQTRVSRSMCPIPWKIDVKEIGCFLVCWQLPLHTIRHMFNISKYLHFSKKILSLSFIIVFCFQMDPSIIKLGLIIWERLTIFLNSVVKQNTFKHCLEIKKK